MSSSTVHGYESLKTRPLSAHQKLLALVPDSSRVLDVGCSTGYLARPLVERGCVVYGVELDEATAAVARETCEEVLVGDVETLEMPYPPTSFDVIVCGDVIEHLRDPRAFLARVRPLLKADGRLVITTPNVANWAIRVGLLFGRWRYTDRGILDRTHTHLFTRSTLAEALFESGYRIVAFDFSAPVPLVGTDAVERVAHAIGSVRPSLFAHQFVVAATPT